MLSQLWDNFKPTLTKHSSPHLELSAHIVSFPPRHPAATPSHPSVLAEVKFDLIRRYNYHYLYNRHYQTSSEASHDHDNHSTEWGANPSVLAEVKLDLNVRYKLDWTGLALMVGSSFCTMIIMIMRSLTACLIMTIVKIMIMLMIMIMIAMKSLTAGLGLPPSTMHCTEACSPTLARVGGIYICLSNCWIWWYLKYFDIDIGNCMTKLTI